MDTVVTLVERDFLYGATALLNSLARNGFKGRYIIGIRDEADLPQHLFQKLKTNPLADSGIEVLFKKSNPPIHYTNFKPDFMLESINDFPDTERLLYLDPDIVMTCPWSFVGQWIDTGIALCADVNHCMPDNHPIRHQWRSIMAQEKLSQYNVLHLFYNGGMLGLKASNADFLKLWSRLISNWGNESNPVDGKGAIGNWRKGGRWNRMHTPDQDALNIAAMAWEGSVSTAGPDAMGFTSGDLYFSHAVGSLKPWNKRYFLNTLQGHPPGIADKQYFNYTQEPTQIYGNSYFIARSTVIKLCSLLGRFYRRVI